MALLRDVSGQEPTFYLEGELDLEKIKGLACKTCITEPYYLVDIDLSGGGKSCLLRFIVDSDNGIGLDELADINRRLGALIDLEELITFTIFY